MADLFGVDVGSPFPSFDKCSALKMPPYFGVATPQYLACKAGGSTAGKLDDLAAKDEHTTVRAIVAKYFPGTEKTKEGLNARQVATAIIGAESGGDPLVKNPAPCSQSGDHAVGLSQICTPMHMSEKDAQDPYKNVAMMRKLYNSCGKSFACDWPTFTGGAYKQYMNWNKAIVVGKSTLSGELVDKVPGVKEVKSVADFLANLLNPSFYARIGKGAMGVVLILIGTVGILFIALSPALGLATKANKLGGVAAKVGRPAAAAAVAAL